MPRRRPLSGGHLAGIDRNSKRRKNDKHVRGDAARWSAARSGEGR
ncbi:hypothetical protein SUDANB51_06812 [Streptomyces sp. enrichment culture]